MTSIRLILTGANARAEVSGVLTSGMVGVPVTIECDDEWEGLEKNLVCRSAVGVQMVLRVENKTIVAPEVLQCTQYGENVLFLGLEGRNADGDLVLPSTTAYCGPIHRSAQQGTDEEADVSEWKVAYINMPEKVKWHQCPEAVRKFVEEVTYDPEDYSVSAIGDYAPAYSVVSNYKPMGKKIGNTTFYNEVPNVETPFLAEDVYGTIKMLDRVRYINTPAAPNVRDVGGWECDGGTVKYGLLFRGGYPSSSDREVLVHELGIRHDLDLCGSDVSVTESPLGAGVYYTRERAYNWYSLANGKVWKANLQCIFRAVTHGEPVYFHCAAGADRTGTLACVLEGLLGMSQSDIDKDYELSSFYSGTESNEKARRRNKKEWRNLIAEINGKEGKSFRDKCVSFAVELGFTADEINAYRAAMIDGTPEKVNPDIDTYTVGLTLENGITADNNIATIARHQPYEVGIECNEAYVISSVKVTMDGVDITDQVWRGKKTDLHRGIRLELSNCSASGRRKRVVDGQCYATYITAEPGYTLDGAEVKILMGGNDVSNYYSDGVIAIPNVTGDVKIVVCAVPQVVSYINQLRMATDLEGAIFNGIGYQDNMRLNSSFSDVSNEGSFVTGYIPAKVGDTIYVLSGFIKKDASTAAVLNFAAYDANKTRIGGCSMAKALEGNAFFKDIITDESGYATQMTINTEWPYFSSWEDLAYIRLSMVGSGEEAVLTVNEIIE